MPESVGGLLGLWLLGWLLWGAVTKPRRYDRRMYSETHWREFHSRMATAIETARRKPAGAHPDRLDGTAFETSAGLLVAVTGGRFESGEPQLHISFSQPGRLTTHRVCSHFGFYVIMMVGGQAAEIAPFYSTNSGVHHLLFKLRTATLNLADFATCYAAHRKHYEPLPYEPADLPIPGVR